MWKKNPQIIFTSCQMLAEKIPVLKHLLAETVQNSQCSLLLKWGAVLTHRMIHRYCFVMGQHTCPRVPSYRLLKYNVSKSHQEMSYRTAFHYQLINPIMPPNRVSFTVHTAGFNTETLRSSTTSDSQNLLVGKHLKMFTIWITPWNALFTFRTALVLQFPEHTDMVHSGFHFSLDVWLIDEKYWLQKLCCDSLFIKSTNDVLELSLTSSKGYPVTQKPV